MILKTYEIKAEKISIANTSFLSSKFVATLHVRRNFYNLLFQLFFTSCPLPLVNSKNIAETSPQVSNLKQRTFFSSLFWIFIIMTKAEKSLETDFTPPLSTATLLFNKLCPY